VPILSYLGVPVPVWFFIDRPPSFCALRPFPKVPGSSKIPLMVHSFETLTPRVHPSAYVSWNAEVVGDVELAEDSSVWYGAVLRGDVAEIRIGRSSNIQDGVVIHVDRGVPCILGEGVTVGHRAVLHGCRVGDWCLIGMAAVILNGAVVGAESIVGAGALVTQGKSFPPRSLILGSPARLVRALDDEEIAALREHAAAYVDLARRAAAGTREIPPPSAAERL